MDYSKLNLWCFLLSSMLVLQNVVVSEPQFPCFFIFGDSLVDNGNNLYRDTTAKVDFFPYGIDFPAGPTGRFNNGRNTVDFIAELLGFEEYIPAFANNTNEDVLGGVNYGSGGAGILHETGRHLGDVISLNEQLSNHKVTISRIAKLLGGKSAAKQHLNSCLYWVGMGNNDYLSNYLPKFYSSTTPYTSRQFAAILISQYSKQLTKLYKIGARKIAVYPVGQLGCVPQQIAASNATSCVQTSNDIVRIFQENLKLLLADLNNRLPGAKFVYTDTSTASYGKIWILSDPCCTESIDGGICAPASVPCSNRDEYMFWDAFHPTEAANLISAKIAYDKISPLFADSIDVW